MIAAAPAPIGSQGGTPAGFLVMGRLLSEERTAQIARTAQLQVTLLPAIGAGDDCSEFR